MAIPPPPETITTPSLRVACDGSGHGIPAALGHPRVWLQIDPEIGHVDCGYCDRRFVLAGHDAAPAAPADTDRGHGQSG
jgi:uncharacterized Zn-finger protein